MTIGQMTDAEKAEYWCDAWEREMSGRARVERILAACAPYLKEGETPAERIEREIKDSAAVAELLRKEREENERLRGELLRAKTRIEQDAGMADCMRRLRNDMIEAGVIDSSVAPMFMTDAILGKLAQLRTYRDAIDEELVSAGSTIESHPDARAALRAVLAWHETLCLTPEISDAAEALIERGRQEMRKQMAEWCEEAQQDIANWAGYASDYFQEKHDLSGYEQITYWHQIAVQALKESA